MCMLTWNHLNVLKTCIFALSVIEGFVTVHYVNQHLASTLIDIELYIWLSSDESRSYTELNRMHLLYLII